MRCSAYKAAQCPRLSGMTTGQLVRTRRGCDWRKEVAKWRKDDATGAPIWLGAVGLEQLRQQRIMEQLAARVAAQGLGVAVPRHFHNLGGRRAGHVGRGHEPPAQAVGSDLLDLGLRSVKDVPRRIAEWPQSPSGHGFRYNERIIRSRLRRQQPASGRTIA